ncbi:MAG: hypothetical protein JKY50_11910 [Oleispira sp.]|nr:hypothetical protein [Oleispira sp.]MBL4881131.1 hypothetical protein [Oleispira sp.]
MIRLFYLSIFVVFSLGCVGQSDNGDVLIPDPVVEEEPLSRYFFKLSENSNIEEEVERVQREYSTAIVHSQLPSTESIILSLSKDDADDIQLEEGSVLTPYFEYGETHDLEGIVGWSRYYFSDDDFLVFKQHIDNIYFSSVGDEINFTYLDNTYSGEVKSYKTHDSGSVFISVGSKEGQMTNLTVFFASSFDSAKLYFDDSQTQYKYEYNQYFGSGYLLPLHEYKYLVGALELD